MDSRLKRRLIIVILAVALVVIFLPMFFGNHEKAEEEAAAPVIPAAPQQPLLEEKLQPVDTDEMVSDQLPAEIEQEAAPIDQEETSVKFDQVDQPKEEVDANSIIQSALDTSIIIDHPNTEQPTAENKVQKNEASLATQEKPKLTVTAAKNETVNNQSKKLATPKTAVKKVAALKVHSVNNKTKTKVLKAPAAKKAQLEIAKNDRRAWVVQLGSFVETKNANALIDQLREKGFHAFGYNRIHNNRTFSRVYIGPFSQLDNAKKTRDELKLAMNMQGIIVSFNPVDID